MEAEQWVELEVPTNETDPFGPVDEGEIKLPSSGFILSTPTPPLPLPTAFPPPLSCTRATHT